MNVVKSILKCALVGFVLAGKSLDSRKPTRLEFPFPKNLNDESNELNKDNTIASLKTYKYT